MKTSDSHKGLRGRCTTPNDMAVHEHTVATASSSKLLETFNNPTTERDYIIQIRIPEFTCLCPKTGQPDFATLELEYVPAGSCLELKSLKQYVWSYRDQGVFHEAVTNTILTDLVSALSPRFARLAARFNVRGGIYTTVIVEHRAEGWAPTEPIEVLRGASSDGMS